MAIWEMLERAVRLHPGKLAVAHGSHHFRYDEVARRATSLARFLSSHGIGSGDRVSILADNSAPFLEAYFAAAGLGAVLNPLNVRLRPDELAFTVRDAGSRWLLADGRYGDAVARLVGQGTPLEAVLAIGEGELPPLPVPSMRYAEALAAGPAGFRPTPVSRDAIAHLYYTSGTTGRPKGVILTHRNVCRHALAAVAELGLSDEDVWGHLAPMFHLADAWATFAITWAGGTHVMVPRFDPEAVFAAIERERITISNLVPTMLNALVHHPRAGAFDTGSLRAILSGGAPIAPDLVRRIVATFRCDYVQTYGMTETSPYLTLSLLKENLRRLPAAEQLAFKAKTGRPFLGVDLEVVDEAGAPVPADEAHVGEIRVRGETVSPGYWNRPDETAAVFRDGWLYTGDLAVVDAEGYLTIVDRKKDVIITGGEKVYSTEIEHALQNHPAVLEAAAFGAPNDYWGEEVRAAVVLKPAEAAAEHELIAHCKERLAGFKVPRAIEFLEELPKTGSGKISKRALREGRSA